MDNSVVEVSVKGVMPTSNGCAVFLGNDTKTFVIYMDRALGEAIQRAVNGEQAERPMTHNLMITLLDGLGAEVERIVINDVKEGTFFARLIVSMENRTRAQDRRSRRPPERLDRTRSDQQQALYAAQQVLDAVDDMTEILAKILKEGQA